MLRRRLIGTCISLFIDDWPYRYDGDDVGRTMTSVWFDEYASLPQPSGLFQSSFVRSLSTHNKSARSTTRHATRESPDYIN